MPGNLLNGTKIVEGQIKGWTGDRDKSKRGKTFNTLGRAAIRAFSTGQNRSTQPQQKQATIATLTKRQEIYQTNNAFLSHLLSPPFHLLTDHALSLVSPLGRIKLLGVLDWWNTLHDCWVMNMNVKMSQFLIPLRVISLTCGSERRRKHRTVASKSVIAYYDVCPGSFVLQRSVPIFISMNSRPIFHTLF